MNKPAFENLHFYNENVWWPLDSDHVGLSISGGRSSAYQAWHIVEANGGLPKGVVAHFANTGRESEETLRFIHRLDQELGLGIVWLEFDMRSNTKVRVVDFETADRSGRPFNEFLYTEIRRRDGTLGVRPLPNPAQRTCTDQLKAKTWHRYARRHLGWPTQYYTLLGYRADEPKRVARRQRRDKDGFKETGKGLYLMYHAGVTSDRKEDFWDSAPFDLEMSSDHGNCDYCFMVSSWKIKERMLMEALSGGHALDPEQPPPRLRFWISAEERISDRPGVFRRDRPTYREIWRQVCEGDMESCVAGENKADRCGECGM